jgi:hypothetical protein
MRGDDGAGSMLGVRAMDGAAAAMISPWVLLYWRTVILSARYRSTTNTAMHGRHGSSPRSRVPSLNPKRTLFPEVADPEVVSFGKLSSTADVKQPGHIATTARARHKTVLLEAAFRIAEETS